MLKTLQSNMRCTTTWEGKRFHQQPGQTPGCRSRNSRLQIQGVFWLRRRGGGDIPHCSPVAHVGARPMGGQPVSVQECLLDRREAKLAFRLREHSRAVVWENVSADKVGLVVLPPHACGLQMDSALPKQTPAVAVRGVLACVQQTVQDLLLSHRPRRNELPATFGMHTFGVRKRDQIHLATAALKLIRRLVVHDRKRCLLWLLELRLRPQAPHRSRRTNGRRHGDREAKNKSEQASLNNYYMTHVCDKC